MILERCGERAKHGRRILGSDNRQEAVHVLHRDDLVTDRTKIPDAVSEEEFGELLRCREAGEIEDSGIDGFEIPAIQGVDQAFAGRLHRPGHGSRRRTHGPAALVALRLLGAFEIVERPEQRQPVLPARQVERRQVDGLQREHRVVLEADMGKRPDTARRRDGQGCQGPAVIQAAPDQAGKLGGDALAGCVFQKAIQGAGLGKRLRQSRPATQSHGGCATGSV